MEHWRASQHKSNSRVAYDSQYLGVVKNPIKVLIVIRQRKTKRIINIV